MPNEEKMELTPEEREDEMAKTLAELVLEAIETCLKDGTWDPEIGVVGKEDTLEETWINARQKCENRTKPV